MAGPVVVIGANAPLGRRVTALLAGRGDEVRTVGPDATDLAAVLDGAGAVVHLGRPVRVSVALDGSGLAAPDEVSTRTLLDAVAAAGVGVVVWLSSAMVYGAWPEQPDPAHRDRTPSAQPRVALRRGPLRPRPPGPRLGRVAPGGPRGRPAPDRDRGSGPPTVAVPVAVVGVGCAERRRRLARRSSCTSTTWPRRSALAVDSSLVGACNVAPDGWIPIDYLRALSRPAPRLRLPAPLADRVARLRWRAGLTGTPPAVLPYRVHPWVVANDRLRAAGWEPGSSNEEAFVEADAVGRLAGLNAHQRQLLSLGAVAAVGLGAVAGVVALVLRRRRRRR